MKRKQISLRSCKEDRVNTKTNCPSNALTVGRLDISKTSVSILKWTMKMKEPQIKHSRKGKNPFIRKSTTKKRTNFYSKEEESSLNESSDSDEEKVLFLGIAEENEQEEESESEE